MTLEFFVTSLIVVLIPGTGVIYTISTGLMQGWRASTAAAFGCTLGIIPHLLASILGLAALLHVSAVAFQTLKFAGVLYLLYLAWSMWRETGVLSFESAPGVKGLRQIIVRGLLINILNPKLSIFFLAFLPQFVPSVSSAPVAQMLALSAIFVAMTLVIFVLYGLGAYVVRSRVASSPKLMRRIQRSFALLFAALGTRLALAEQ